MLFSWNQSMQKNLVLLYHLSHLILLLILVFLLHFYSYKIWSVISAFFLFSSVPFYVLFSTSGFVQFFSLSLFDDTFAGMKMQIATNTHTHQHTTHTLRSLFQHVMTPCLSCLAPFLSHLMLCCLNHVVCCSFAFHASRWIQKMKGGVKTLWFHYETLKFGRT